MKFNSRNLSISPDARIGSNVRIGDGAVIYPGVELGDGCVVCNDVVVGEPLAAYYDDPGYRHPATRIGCGSLIRSHTIIYAGCRIGEEVATGHRVTIRENASIGDHCMIGTLSDIQSDVRMGSYCRLHSSVHIAQFCTMEDFVFFYPFSVMTNDPWPPSSDLRGGHIGSYTQIGVHAVILPGVRVGENCLVGANSVVSKTVPPHSLAVGDPARVLMDLRDYVAMGKGHPYPWMVRFDRGMPWEKIGFERWMQGHAEYGRPHD